MIIDYDFRTAAELKAWRSAAGWSQRDLARTAGVHVNTVKYHEGLSGVIGGWAVNRFRSAFELGRVLPPNTSRVELFLQAGNSPHGEDGLSLCGAKTRKGAPCRAKALPGRNRCKFHGGMSTGPKTIQGRDRIAEAQRRRWREYHAAQASSAG
ncbi:HGGxSTG domain-containing protein [Mesorhizobium sp. A556]